MFSKFFIDRPIFATVLSLLLIVAGLVTLYTLPVAQYPNITPPTVQVSTTYPGANAQTIAQTVGIPIEQQINGVEGMLYMSSNSSSSGSYNLTITFEVGTDIDMASVMVQNRLNAVSSSLPEAVKQQGVTVTKQSSNIVLFLTLTGDSIYDGLYLSNYAQLHMVEPLKRVEGVGAVDVMGAGNYAMRVWLHPEEMRIREVTAQEVYSALQEQNMQVSAGYVGLPLGQQAHNAFQYSLDVKGRLQTPEEFGNIVIRSDEQGALLRLRDIATVDLGSVSYTSRSRLNGQEAAAIAIYQLPGSNSLDVATGVKACMKELAEAFPPGVEYHLTLDTTRVVHSSINEVLKTFGEALLLVMLVIFLFLQNWRAVLIPSFTIPVSLIGTLAVMALFGFSINTLTLFGLILAIAIVVDDAIVVVENATRLLDTGRYTPKQAVTKAMEEILGPVVGIVLVLLAVFVPTTFIGGISGQLYKQFALTIAAATVLSGLNALTLTPALCALLLRKAPERKAWFFRRFDHLYNKVQHRYERMVDFLLRRPLLTFLSFLLLTVGTLYLFTHRPTTFLPEEDDGYFIVAVQLPPAASLERTEAVGNLIDGILNSYPEVESYMGISGFSIMNGGAQSNGATYFVVLKDWSERKKKGESAASVVARFNREAYLRVEAAQVFAMVPPAIPGLGNTGGLQLELEDRRSMGTQEMQKGIEALIAHYQQEPSIGGISSSFEANVPQYFLKVDRNKTQVMGVNLSDVFSTLSYYLGQAYVNDFIDFDRVYQVYIAAGELSQEQIQDVLALTVMNSQGEMVPFSSFLTPEEQLGTNQITRYNLYPAATLTCNVASGHSSGETIEGVSSLIKNQLGSEFGYEWTSVAYQEIHAGSTTTLILLIALLVAFLVLAAQYESWTSPVAAVMGVPIALLGAVVGCWVMGLAISIYTQIGIVLLIALSAKNGILIVEFARDYRKEGNSIRESAFEAGRVRLRPILMTSFAFIFGVLPLLFATGAGAASRLSLGTAVVFGMTLNTLLATLFIPSWYEWMQTLQERWLQKRRDVTKKESEIKDRV
jgi:hydrophobe/amphiphile efflux-1 (HAE1) family protein